VNPRWLPFHFVSAFFGGLWINRAYLLYCSPYSVMTIGVFVELFASGSGGVAPAGAGSRQPLVFARRRDLFCVLFLSVLAMISYTAPQLWCWCSFMVPSDKGFIAR